jgi:tetratricopeptide (TPR) repeat protein
MPYDPDLVWVELDSAALASASGRYPEAQDRYRQAIAILAHDGFSEQEADAWDALSEACAKGGKPRDAARARERAAVLRKELRHG